MLNLTIEEIYNDYNDFLLHVDCSNMNLLFHGGLQSVNDPKADYYEGNYYADFGIGFYTTTIPEQAEGWAQQSPGNGKGIVSVYAFTDCLDNYFFGWEYTPEWINFIKECRNNGRTYDMGDLIIGRVADDQIWKPVMDYVAGKETLENTIDALNYKASQQNTFDDQYCFTTNRGIKNARRYLGAYYAE